MQASIDPDNRQNLPEHAQNVLLLVRAAHQLLATILARLRRKLHGAQLREWWSGSKMPITLPDDTALGLSGGAGSVSRKRSAQLPQGEASRSPFTRQRTCL